MISTSFDTEEMSEAEYILCVKILRDRSNKILCLSQQTYTMKILKHFQMSNCKTMDTLVEMGETLSLEICPKIEKEKKNMFRVPYSSAVKSLIYAMMCTRPNICML